MTLLGLPVPDPRPWRVAATVLLPYTHFSVLMRLDKRLAAVTALGIDGEKLRDFNRAGIPWRLDPGCRRTNRPVNGSTPATTSTAGTW